MTRLLLIGAAGLDWATFDAGCRSGHLPELAALRQRGASGWLGGAPATFGPAPWATLVTGLQPELHGVWRDVEEWPGGLRPTSQASWRYPPVWARLEAAGVSTGSVAWRAARPGDAWPGLHIDESFAEPTGAAPEDWALPRRCVPEDLRDVLRGRRVHPLSISHAMLKPLVPRIAEIDQSRDDGLPMIAVGLARASTIQSAALWMLTERPEGPPAATFVHQPVLGRLRFAFERRQDAKYATVIPAGAGLLDRLIGKLAATVGSDCRIVVVSPGWRDSPGFLLAAGQGVSPVEGVAGAGLLDITPTVLAQFGLGDPELPGRPLPFIAEPTDLAAAPHSTLPAPAKPDALLVYGLRKHGYRPPPRPSRAWKAQGLAELALMVLDRDPAVAAAAADASLALDAANISALRIKARACLALDRADDLPALAAALAKVAPSRGWSATAQAAYHVLRGELSLAEPELRRAEADRDPASLLTVAAIWLAAARPASAERVFRFVLDEDPVNVSAEIGLAMGATARRDFLTAEQALMRALKLDPARPAIFLQLTQVYARSARRTEAANTAALAHRLGVPRPLIDEALAGALPS